MLALTCVLQHRFGMGSPEEVGNRVRATREARKPKMSQQDLAVAVGVTTLAIGNIENGKTLDPKVSTMQSIAEVLGVSLEWLLNGDRAEEMSNALRAFLAVAPVLEPERAALMRLRASTGVPDYAAELARLRAAPLAFPKVVDRSETTTRGDTGLTKTSLKPKRKS